jgi:DNA-binding SARP family transcriptional activator
MEFQVLGPLQVREHGRALELGGRKLRALLAILLLRAGAVVSSDQLIDGLWSGAEPRSAQHLLHVYVSSLRKALESAGGDGSRPVLVTRAPGYVLEVGRDALDSRRFEGLLTEGRRLLAIEDQEGAATVLREALVLWRGPAFADFTYEPFAQAEIARLEELRLVALEERIEADLAMGLHLDLIGELEALSADNPLRERPRGQLMLALYRSARQADGGCWSSSSVSSRVHRFSAFSWRSFSRTPGLSSAQLAGSDPLCSRRESS